MRPAQPSQLVLASASPRRRALLHDSGLEAVVRPSGIEEHSLPTEAPRTRVLRLARLKAASIVVPDVVVIGADTEVVIDGRALGKPRDAEDAERMLRKLQGRSHEVITGVHVVRVDDGRSAESVDTTLVSFRDVGDRFIRRYVATGEPLDKAGGYGIQERGGLMVERIQGSWSNVVGLPLERLPELFARIDVDLLQYWR